MSHNRNTPPKKQPMILQTDYPIAALELLLNRECMSERYYPLLIHKDQLLSGLKLLGCRTKNAAAALPEDAFAQIGISDPGTIRLLKRFLSLYDPNPQKFREIPKLCSDPQEQAAFRELYHLPGVRYVRARLYDQSGFHCLADIAQTTVQEVLDRTAQTIAAQQLSCTVPLPKEVRTHIAVAKALLYHEA